MTPKVYVVSITCDRCQQNLVVVHFVSPPWISGSLQLGVHAGTGKSIFLKYLDKIEGKNIVKLAPTGVAAINEGI